MPTVQETVTSTVVWFEIPATDFSRAIQFYETILGSALIHQAAWPNLAIFPYEKPGVSGAIAHGDHGLADVCVGGDEQDGQRGKILAHAAERFEAGKAGHPHIGNHHGKFSGGQKPECAFARIGGDGIKALAAQERIQQAALAGVIVHDEDARRFV